MGAKTPPIQADLLSALDANSADSAFVCFVSPETRCAAAPSRFSRYRAGSICILKVEDEPNTLREQNLRELRSICAGLGEIAEIGTTHRDPVIGIDELVRTVSHAAVAGNGNVTVDVSTFPKDSLLLTLKAIDLISSVRRVRVVYTEPERYVVVDRINRQFGLRGTHVVPSFCASFRPNEELVLVMVLGYEGNRAVSLWQSIQPHRTIGIIGRPSYRMEWKGISEKLNAPVLATLSAGELFFVDARNPWSIYEILERTIAQPQSQKAENFYIAPLGTKPETVGVYLFTKHHPDAASIVYASPVDHDHAYIASGVGPTWVLAEWANGQP